MSLPHLGSQTRGRPVSWALGLTSAPLHWRLLQLCFGPLSPLPRQIRPQAGHGEREPLGVSLSSHSHHRQVARSGHQTLPIATHTEGTMSTQSDSSYWERNACESRRFKEARQQTNDMGIFDCQALFLPLPSSSCNNEEDYSPNNLL